MLTPSCRPSKSFSVQELDLESDTRGGGGDMNRANSDLSEGLRPHQSGSRCLLTQKPRGPPATDGPLLTTIPKPKRERKTNRTTTTEASRKP